jgi:hypothetical protein
VWALDKQVDPECESAADRRVLRLIVEHPDFRGLERQVFDVGGCEHPIRLSGVSVRRLVATGEVVKYLASRDAPAGVILIRCMNRRASRCASCARLYQGDTYQLIRAGVAGGKGVPASVAGNPQVFATLTAPSFGAVHRAHVPGTKEVCRWRLPGAKCPHGAPYGCRVRHEPGDPLVGQALCLPCYDYVGAVLFNACASELWKALSDNLYHHLAAHAGVSQREIRRLLHVEYVRVAEYQARGAVHFHLVLRIDGPDGVGSPAPVWASAQVLIAALGSARSVTKLRVPDGFDGVKVLRFGGQPQEVGEPIVFDESKGMTPEKVAGYLAKYTSKGTEDAHGSDTPIRHVLEIEDSGRTAHVRALMRTAWRLGGPEYEDVEEFRGLRRVCHMLGYRGNVCTASRGYSVTRKALRAARAAYRSGEDPAALEGTVTESFYAYAGRGYGDLATEELAEDVRGRIVEQRELARDAAEIDAQRGGWAA